MNSPDDFTGPCNLGNPNEFSMLQVAQLVIELTGSKSKLVNRPLPQDDPRQRQPDINMAKNSLGWEPTQQLREGLTKTIHYFQNRLNT